MSDENGRYVKVDEDGFIRACKHDSHKMAPIPVQVLAILLDAAQEKLAREVERGSRESRALRKKLRLDRETMDLVEAVRGLQEVLDIDERDRDVEIRPDPERVEVDPDLPAPGRGHHGLANADLN